MSAVTTPTAPAYSTTGGTSIASASFTPNAGGLLVVFVAVTGQRPDGTAASATGGQWLTDSQGLGFVQVDYAAKATSADSVYCFVASKLAAASAMTVTFNCAQDTSTGSVLAVFDVSGMTRLGADAVRQTAKTSNGAAAATPAPVFAASCLTGNPLIGCVFNASNPAAMTPPTGFTETTSGDSGYATPTAGAEFVQRDSGFTGTTVTWGSTTATAFCALVVELDTSAAVRTPPYIANVAAGQLANSGNVTFNVATLLSPAVNDIICLAVESGDNVAATATGYTQKHSVSSSTTSQQTLLWRRADGSEGSTTVTHAAGSSIIVTPFLIRGAIASGDPFEATNGVSTGTGTTLTGATVTSLTDCAMILALFSEGEAGTSGADVVGAIGGTSMAPAFATVSQAGNFGGTNTAYMAVAFGQQRTAAATGAKTATVVGPGATPAWNAALLVVTGLAVAAAASKSIVYSPAVRRLAHMIGR